MLIALAASFGAASGDQNGDGLALGIYGNANMDDTIENSEKPNLIDNYKYYYNYIIVHEKPH